MSKDSFSEDLMHYDLKIQEALRGVIQGVLLDVSAKGLPGDHHFYITFQTHYPGVRLSKVFREKYPEEMTIVLQNQFWNLSVHKDVFEVDLSFSGKPESLAIPFKAITGFFDPSVQFGLKFEEHSYENDDEDTSLNAPGATALIAKKIPSGKGISGQKQALRQKVDPTDVFRKEPFDTVTSSGAVLEDVVSADCGESSGVASNVVSLDLFRKK
jgi:hypothetical protein